MGEAHELNGVSLGPMHSSGRVGDHIKPKRVFLILKGVTSKGVARGSLRLMLRTYLRTEMSPHKGLQEFKLLHCQETPRTGRMPSPDPGGVAALSLPLLPAPTCPNPDTTAGLSWMAATKASP